MKLITLLLVFFASISLAKDQSICPIMVDSDIDEEEFVEFDGKKVFMCCGACTKAWNKSPKYYLKAGIALELLPQFAGLARLEEELKDIELMPQRFCPLRTECVVGPESPSVEYEGKKIYFFKERDIARKWTPKADEKFAAAREAGLLPQFDEKEEEEEKE